MTTQQELRQAYDAAQMVDEFIVHLNELTGIHMDALLAGAHGCIVAMLAERLGEDMAAERCEAAAVSLRRSISDASLAAARPMGSA